MSFTDYLFFPFLAVVFLVYFVVPLTKRWIVLLAASLCFYCTWGIELLPFVFGAVFVAWGTGCLIERQYEKQDQRIKDAANLSKEEKAGIRFQTKRRCRRFLWAAVVMIIGLLVYTKAQRLLAEIPVLSAVVWFFSKIFQHIARWGLRIPLIRLFVHDTEAAGTISGYSFFVPLGISYYSMSLVGYIADVYWRKEKAEKSFFKMALFAFYFPKIIEGPISKHRTVMDSLSTGHSFDYKRFCFGLQRMLWGFFKKLVIADRLLLFITPVFENYTAYQGSVILVAAIFGTFQMYCDFSGCMDIALGISEVFGVRLEENFNRPFFSQSVAEFWRRWHMSLSTWFKDYIYLPMVISPKLIKLSGAVKNKWGKRAGKSVMTIVPTLTIWLLTGLWHGTGWNFIVWGMYWGVLMLISNLFEPEIRRLTVFLHIHTETRGFHVFRVLRTFFLYVIARVITLSGTLVNLGGIIGRILHSFGPWCLVNGALLTAGNMDRSNFYAAILALLFLFAVSRKQEEGVVIREKIAEMNIVPRWVIYLAGIFAVLVFGIYGPGYNASSFVYMQY